MNKLKGKITKYQSTKNDYRYVWDEQKNFIIYQNSSTNIILGKISHDGLISESEITKLYEISILDFDINFLGSGGKVNLKHTIFLNNFYYMARETKVLEIINELWHLFFLNTLTQKELNKVKSTQQVLTFNTSKIVTNKNVLEKLYPSFWQFDMNNQENLGKMVINITDNILKWLYNIGLRRIITSPLDGDYLIDNFNQELMNMINEIFKNNLFDVNLEREEFNNNLLATSEKENMEYNNCMNVLNNFITKILGGSVTKEEIKEASIASLKYRKIVGKFYYFTSKLAEYSDDKESEDSTLKRTNKYFL